MTAVRSLAYVLAQPERPEESDSQLRFGFGAEAPAQDRAEFSRRYGCPLLESYGSSEGTCYIIHTPDGALGVPQQGFVVEIVNALGEVCSWESSAGGRVFGVVVSRHGSTERI